MKVCFHVIIKRYNLRFGLSSFQPDLGVLLLHVLEYRLPGHSSVDCSHACALQIVLAPVVRAPRRPEVTPAAQRASERASKRRVLGWLAPTVAPRDADELD